jgi:hypothetical protein
MARPSPIIYIYIYIYIYYSSARPQTGVVLEAQ